MDCFSNARSGLYWKRGRRISLKKNKKWYSPLRNILIGTVHYIVFFFQKVTDLQLVVRLMVSLFAISSFPYQFRNISFFHPKDRPLQLYKGRHFHSLSLKPAGETFSWFLFHFQIIQKIFNLNRWVKHSQDVSFIFK